MTTVNMATMVGREHAFQASVSRVIKQVRILNVYLDGYKTVPTWLTDLAKPGSPLTLRTQLSKDQDYSLHGAGKFSFLGDQELGEPYITLDDDILVGPDFVRDMVRALETRPDAIVGVHGIRILLPMNSYSKDRKVWSYDGGCASATRVDCLGTGAMAWYPRNLRLDWYGFPFENPQMLDIHVGMLAKAAGIPMICIPRKMLWVRNGHNSGESMFGNMQLDDSKHTELARQIWRSNSDLAISKCR